MTTLDELRRLEQAATPGVWSVSHSIGAPEVVTRERRVAKVLYHGGSEDRLPEKNAALIAAARNALPALLRVAGIAAELYDALQRYEQDVDDSPTDDHRQMMKRAAQALAALEAPREH